MDLSTPPESNGGLMHFNAETARDLLQVLAIPRNNHIELFHKPVQVGLRDIEDLTRKVAIKLRQLNVDPTCTAMKTLIALDKDRNHQLIGLSQLKSFDWTIAERTRSITLTWEFMYQQVDGAHPELHVLSVKITEAPNPMQFLRAALSQDREEAERIEIKMAPVVCEVDYVDRLLSRELVQIVGEWHQSLRRPAPLIGLGDFIQKYQNKICKTVDVSLEFVLPLTYVSAAYIWMSEKISNPLDTAFVAYSATIVMMFSLMVKMSSRFAKLMAKTISQNVDRMGRFPIFELTSGDQNNLTAAVAKVTASTYKFWFHIATSFVVNLASAIFTVYVLGIK